MHVRYPDLWQALARRIPDRPAIISADGTTLTYAELVRDAGALAATLTRGGLRPGDRVALLLYNRPEFLVAFFACLALGLTPAPMNYRFRRGELLELLDDSSVAALIFPTSLASTAVGAAHDARRTPLLIHIVDDRTAAVPGTSWDDAVAVAEPLPAEAPAGEFWIYTGGTTGRPKAVRWGTDDMFEAQLVPTYAALRLRFPESLDDAVTLALDSGVARVVNLPLAPFIHGTALTTSVNTLTLGGTILTTASATLDPAAALAFAVANGATRLVVAGDAVVLPLVEAAERDGVRLGSVRLVQSSGMRFSPEAKRRLHALGDFTILDLLASTEGGLFAITTTTGAADLPGLPRLVPTAAVLDDDGRDVQDEVGAVGVLAQHGALPIGYYGDEQKTRETFPTLDGVRYVIPGDWVRVLADRHVEFLGRGSGVINTGGEKVYPPEVEEALLTHPAVLDATVLGVPDPRFGEIVAAVVVVRRGHSVSAAELGAHVGSRLAGYKKPRHVLFRDSLERTPTGKVVVARLRDEVAEDRRRNGGQ